MSDSGDSNTNSFGCFSTIIGFIIVICVAVIASFTVGIIIGAFNSLKNYFISLKHNLYDSNFLHAETTER